MKFRKFYGIVVATVTPIAAYKKACEFRGIPAGPPRLPLRPLTPDEEKKLKGELEALGLL